MTWYRSIKASNPPYNTQLKDPQGRPMLAFVIEADKVDSDTFSREIVKLLIDAAVVTALGTDIFAGDPKLPTDKTRTFLTVTETTGAAGILIQNQNAPAYERPSAKIMAHGATYDAGMALARSAYRTLVSVRNINVTL